MLIRLISFLEGANYKDQILKCKSSFGKNEVISCVHAQLRAKTMGYLHENDKIVPLHEIGL